MDGPFLGAVIALIGVAIGGIVSVAVEALRHRWSVSDRDYDRKKEILDRRCDQAETYAQAMTQDFRFLMRDIEAYMFHPDPTNAERINKARLERIDKYDNSIFSLGPAISAIDHDEMKRSWTIMMDKMDELQDTYRDVSAFIFDDGEEIDPIQVLDKVNGLWLDYSEHMGNFYRNLDDAREGLLLV